MTERLICNNYEINQIEYELWLDSDGSWWLSFGGVQQDEDQFSTKEIDDILQYIEDWRKP